MSDTLRVVLIVASVLCLLFTLRKISQSKVRIDDAIFWIVGAFGLVIISIFPQISSWCCDLLGIQAPVNFLFLFMIFILLVKLFYMTIRVSQLESKVKELSQRYALDHMDEDEVKRDEE